MARKISRKGRQHLKQNARKGTSKWHRMSHRARVNSVHRKSYSWGFEGKSPHTHNRTHKKRKK